MTAMTTSRRIAREAALWIGGALGALCLVSLVAGWALHVTPLVFASGSMTPAYDVGSLGIARQAPASDLRIGDVVSVVNDQGVRVTHRIVAVAHQGAYAQLTLQGDTNNTPDAQTYVVSAAPRVAFGVPYAGYVLNAAASPYGVAVTAAAVMGLLFLGFGGSAAGSARRRTRALIPAGVASVLVVGGIAGASGAAPWAFTSAYWTDTATATTAASVAGATDTTPPALSNPVPATDAVGSLWSGLACSAAASQICVNATDNVGVTSVSVALKRTTTTAQCWNGGTTWQSSCSAQPMTLASGSQYRTSGLSATNMTAGIYQATFTAKDAANNSTTLTVNFAVGWTVGCSRPDKSHATLTWSGLTGATYSVVATNNGGSPVTTSPATSPFTSTFGNNDVGTLGLTATAGGASVTSSWIYDGSGAAVACHQ